MASPILIVMEGGLIQSIHSNAPEGVPPIVVIDYDIEDADPEDLVEVPQSEDPNDTTPAYVIEFLTYRMFPHVEEFLWDFLEGVIE